MSAEDVKGRSRKRPFEPEEIEWKEYARIPPGEYRAFCKWGKQYRDPGFKRWMCLLRWDVFSENLSPIACAPMFLPLGNGVKPHASRRGKYLPEWIRAKGAQPIRGDRLSPRVFVYRMAHVQIGDTEGPAPYSVVRKIIEWETGLPCHSISKSHNQGRQHKGTEESEALRE